MRALSTGAILVLTSCGGVEPSCEVLQEHYDDCCFTCGASDSYCSTAFDVTEDPEAACKSELLGTDLSSCICDE